MKNAAFVLREPDRLPALEGQAIRGVGRRDGHPGSLADLPPPRLTRRAPRIDGVPRIGLQDHVELRTANAAARLVDASSYRAERGDRVVRRTRFHKFSGHRRMYADIARRIARQGAGDTRRSVEVSTQLVLALEAELVRARGVRV